VWCGWQVTDEGICALSRGCPDLKSLILSGVHELTDRSIIALANGCPHVEELYMSGCSMITRTAIRYLVVSVAVYTQSFYCPIVGRRLSWPRTAMRVYNGTHGTDNLFPTPFCVMTLLNVCNVN